MASFDHDSPHEVFDTDIERYFAKHQQPQSRTKALLSKHIKHTIKYLAGCKNPQAYRSVLRAAPDDVIKALCNVALNVEQGDISLSPKDKALFRKHRRAISLLTSPQTSLKRKRSLVQNQKGGFFFIPPLILSALGALGSGALGALAGGLVNKVMNTKKDNA